MANTGGYQPIGPEAPLLNPTSPTSNSKWKTTSYILGALTSLLVAVTFISSFIFHTHSSVALNVFFSVCILLACISNVGMIFWYRQQVLASAMRFIIYLNSLNIVLLCVCANLYHHGY